MTNPDALRTIRMMHLVERIAARFNEAGIPLMALKGAALNLALYDEPGERPMADLDLMVRVEDVEAAQALLEDVGCHRSDVVFREDFFPKYYYEIEYTAGSVDPVLIDLHVRPFRVLRYARLIAQETLWQRAVPIAAGTATILIPAPDDMLIHLAVHSAIHANCRELWLQDIARWAAARRDEVDWQRLLDTLKDWRLSHAVASALAATERLAGPVLPPHVRQQLARAGASWRDRLALWHAPRDGDNRTASLVVNVVTTPGLRFTLGYLRDVLVPDRQYMDGWCARHDCSKPAWAHVRRCLAPVARRLPRLGSGCAVVEVRKSAVHGLGVFTKRELKKGEVIARYRGRPIERDGTYVAYHTDPTGDSGRHEITGPLRFLNHSCRPNARIESFRLIALRPIRAGRELKIDYGVGTCVCQAQRQGAHDEG